MTTTNMHTVNLDQPIEKVHETLTDAGSWEKVANHFSIADGKVEKFNTTDAGAAVTIHQTASADRILTQAQKFVKSGVGMTHTFVISPLSDSGAASTVTTETSGVPASFSASQKLTVQGEGSVLTANSELVINVPLLGGRLEEGVAPHPERILNAETVVLADYIAEQICAAAALPRRHRGGGYRGRERWQRRSRR